MTIAAFPAKNPASVTADTNTQTRRLLKEREAAAFLGVSAALLRKQRMHGSTERSQAVPFIRVGGRGVRYDLNDLSEWIAARRVVR